MSLTNPVFVTLPPDLLEQAEACTKLDDETVSRLVNNAIRKYLQDSAQWDEVFRFGRQRGEELGISSEEDVERLCDEYRQEKRAALARS